MVKISCLYHQLKYSLKFAHLAAPLIRRTKFVNEFLFSDQCINRFLFFFFFFFFFFGLVCRLTSWSTIYSK